MTRRVRRLALAAGGLLVALLAAAQAVPYGRAHANPPVRVEPVWDSAQTRELAVRACFDCHSSQTRWPWYSSVAPVSWLVQHDVDEGRAKLNFSEWDRRQEANEAAEVVAEGEMPPWYYAALHPEAQLSEAERAALVSGLSAFAGDRRGEGESRRGESRGR